ncbi:MAG: hypothetical protein RQ729_11195 [Wenzhouxiangellaceae bacterium]|nr:hypothetical protein [Wenzhouxiangellaceae bacterium]
MRLPAEFANTMRHAASTAIALVLLACLLAAMQQSIAEADRFIASLKAG